MHAFRRSEYADFFHPIQMSFREGPPWNKGMVVGQMRPFTKTQIQSITRTLEEKKSFRDLCLFCLGIDTMLRSSDLVDVKAEDVIAPDVSLL